MSSKTEQRSFCFIVSFKSTNVSNPIKTDVWIWKIATILQIKTIFYEQKLKIKKKAYIIKIKLKISL